MAMVGAEMRSGERAHLARRIRRWGRHVKECRGVRARIIARVDGGGQRYQRRRVDTAPAAREPEGDDHRARHGGGGGGRVLLLRWLGLQPIEREGAMSVARGPWPVR